MREHLTIVSKYLAFTSLLMLMVSTPHSYADDKPLQISIATGEWPPLISEQLPNGGELTRLVTQAFQQQGIEPNYTYFPWARSLLLTKSGTYDASPGWMFNRERAKHFYFSEPILKSQEVLIMRKDNPLQIKQFSDLQGTTIAAIRSYSYGDHFDDAEAKDMFTTIRNKEVLQNLKMVLIGRVDIAIIERPVFEQVKDSQLSALEIEQLKIIPSVLPNRDLYLLVSKKSPQAQFWLSEFNKGLAKLLTVQDQ